MVTEHTHIDGGMLDLVLTDVSDIVGVKVDSPVGTLNHTRKTVNISPVLARLRVHWLNI